MTDISAWLNLKHLSDCSQQKVCEKFTVVWVRGAPLKYLYNGLEISTCRNIQQKRENRTCGCRHHGRRMMRFVYGDPGPVGGDSEIYQRWMICLIAEKVEWVCVTHYFLLTEVLWAVGMFGGRRQAFLNVCPRPGWLDWITRDRHSARAHPQMVMSVNDEERLKRGRGWEIEFVRRRIKILYRECQRIKVTEIK